MKKRMLYFVIAFITSFGFTAVQAQAQDMGKKAYIGVSIANVNYDLVASDISSSENGWGLNYGYQFTDILGMEVFYGRVDNAKIAGIDFDATVLETSLLARMPSQASPFIRLGLSTGDTTLTESDTAFLIGVGIDFNIGESAAIRLEYNQADFDGGEVERLQLGTIFRF